MISSNSVPHASRTLSRLVGLAALVVAAPSMTHAQSGKWVATIGQLSGIGGSVDLTVEPRNDKQSRAKVSLRNITDRKGDMRLSWDIVAGNCREEGRPIAPQAAFTLVQTSMDGSGTSSANIPKLESGKPYYVRVFDPQTAPTDAAAYGCGNLSEKP